MKKNILLILALMLVLTVSVAYGDTLMLEQGNIIVYGDNQYEQAGRKSTLQDPDEGLIITQMMPDIPTRNTVRIGKDAGEVYLTLVDTGMQPAKGAALDILPGANVTLTLEGINILIGGENGAGISVAPGATLAIESDSDAKGFVGELEATGGENAAGIGGNPGQSHGDILINGGKITAQGGLGGAGVGGGRLAAGGNVTIEDGIVLATGGQYASGIGGGRWADGGKLTLVYGELTVRGGTNASGIGGGQGGNGGVFTMEDGVADVVGGMGAAGIGGGDGAKAGGDGGVCVIEEGDLNAEGGSYGAGIGGGYIGEGGSITISGGYVTATGGKTAAGIGGGGATVKAKGGSGGNIAISGGTLMIKGGDNAAGIGGGMRGNGGNITITGSKINTLGGIKGAGIGGGYYGDGGVIVIEDGFIRAEGGLAGAGIGGGEQRPGGSVTFNGGRVTAVGGKYSAGIGGGWEGEGGTLIFNGAEVTAQGGEYAAGIGGGGTNRDGIGGAGGQITINAGNITATQGTYSAGIGGGMRAAGGNVEINGGIVSANGAIGIGGGQDGKPGQITINAGTVTAEGGKNGYSTFATLVIKGGSLMTDGIMFEQPTNGEKALVPVAIKLPGVLESINVKGLLEFSTLVYGDNDLMTTKAGVLNMWLPETTQEHIIVKGYVDMTTDLPIPVKEDVLHGQTKITMENGGAISLSDESGLAVNVNGARVAGQVYDPVTLEKLPLRMCVVETSGGFAMVAYIQDQEKAACFSVSQKLLEICETFGVPIVGFGLGDKLALVKVSDLRGEAIKRVAEENGFKESLTSFHIELAPDGSNKLSVKKGFDAVDVTELSLIEVTTFDE